MLKTKWRKKNKEKEPNIGGHDKPFWKDIPKTKGQETSTSLSLEILWNAFWAYKYPFLHNQEPKPILHA
jgi:hypothetical protein